MTVLFTNNASTTLSAGIAPGATAVVVTDGSVFPAISSPDIAYLTLISGSDIEVIKVTNRAGNTLTVVRAQDGTAAASFLTGDRCELRLTNIALTEALAERQLASAALDAVSGTNTGDEVAATTTTAGIVEKSTGAENTTGTSTTVYPTVGGVKDMIDTHTASPIALILALG